MGEWWIDRGKSLGSIGGGGMFNMYDLLEKQKNK
jgi:hypothetical protein